MERLFILLGGASFFDQKRLFNTVSRFLCDTSFNKPQTEATDDLAFRYIILIIIPQAIHISAQCHLLPSSKDGEETREASFRATTSSLFLPFGLDCTAFVFQR